MNAYENRTSMHSSTAPPVSRSRAVLQRKCSCSGECADCRKKQVQRSATSTATPQTAPKSVNDVLRSPGKPLDAEARAIFEPRFGHDFSNVRIHADAQAAQSAHAVDALAYTVGNDIAFAAGRYHPATPQGQELLAHELAHVVQQGGASPKTGELEVSAADSASERQADSAARTAMRGGSRINLNRQAVGISRAPDPNAQGAPGRATVAPLPSSSTMDGFATGSAAIPDERKLDLLAQYIRSKMGKAYAIITGHTDAIGSEASNRALGQQRADATKAALIARGLPAIKLTTASAGASDPAVKTTKEEAKNRRVDVRMIADSNPTPAAPQTEGASQAAPQADVPKPDAPSPWSMDPRGTDAPPASRPNLNLPPDYLEKQNQPLPGPRAQTLPPEFYNPVIPANPIKPSPPILDSVYNATAGKVITALARAIKLSPERTKQLNDVVRDGVLKGSKEILKLGLTRIGANTQEINAAEAAFEAAVKTKGGQSQPPQ